MEFLQEIAAELSLRLSKKQRLFLISDDVVTGLFGAGLVEALKVEGFTVLSLEFPCGEANKTRRTLSMLQDVLLRSGAERDDVIVALGGGLVLDVAGFAAATVGRGMQLVQIPTTLLAMVDASVGDKRAVNTEFGKNSLGVFYPESFTIRRTEFLETLPARDYNAGLVEVLKLGFCCDAALLDLAMEPENTEELISRAVTLKEEIVAADPQDMSTRHVLNYGHTLGHAFELLMGGALLHGEAVAIGIRAAASYATAIGISEKGWEREQNETLDALGMPRTLELPKADCADALARIEALLAHDKKREEGTLRMVLSPAKGQKLLNHTASQEQIEKIIAHFL